MVVRTRIYMTYVRSGCLFLRLLLMSCLGCRSKEHKTALIELGCSDLALLHTFAHSIVHDLTFLPENGLVSLRVHMAFTSKSKISPRPSPRPYFRHGLRHGLRHGHIFATAFATAFAIHILCIFTFVPILFQLEQP